jgi:hypothetical protein
MYGVKPFCSPASALSARSLVAMRSPSLEDDGCGAGEHVRPASSIPRPERDLTPRFSGALIP